MIDLSNSHDLCINGLIIENIEKNDLSTSFDVCFKDLIERVIINTPSYRTAAKIGFHPICIKMIGENGLIITLGSYTNRLKLYITQYMDNDISGEPIIISNFLQNKINKYLKYPITNNILIKNDISKNIQFLTQQTTHIPMFNDISEMVIYDINDFIIESINSYIYTAYEKFTNNPTGYNKSSITSYLMSLLTSQLTQYIEKCPSEIQKRILEIDSEDKIILPEECNGQSLLNNEFVAQNDGPQSEHSGRVVHKYINTSIQNRSFVKDKTNYIPFSRLQATSPYCRNIFQNRLQVRRACTTQNLDLLSNEPLVISEQGKNIPIPGMTLHVAFFQWGYTLEDGIIISRSAADKMTGYKIHQDTFSVREGMTVEILVNSLNNQSIDDLIKSYRQYFNFNKTCRFKRKGTLAIINNKESIKTTAKIPGIIFEIKAEDYEIQTNSGNGQKIEKRTRFTIKSLLKYKLDIGDKLAGYYHGNKGTIARIVEDEKMPTINGERVDVVMDPSICKRGIPSLVFECHDSMKAKQLNQKIYIDILKSYERDFSNCYHQIKFENDNDFNMIDDLVSSILPNNNVLHGYIRMSRLDHNSVEKLTYTNHVKISNDGAHNTGAITLPGIQFVLYAKGCDNALKEIMKDNGIVPVIENHMHVFGKELKDFIGGV